MSRLLPVLLLVLLAAPFVASLATALDDCSGDACDPIRCAASCPLCSCSLDRDRMATEGMTEAVPMEPTLDRLAPIALSLPAVPPQDILHVPRPFLA